MYYTIEGSFSNSNPTLLSRAPRVTDSLLPSEEGGLILRAPFDRYWMLSSSDLLFLDLAYFSSKSKKVPLMSESEMGFWSSC